MQLQQQQIMPNLFYAKMEEAKPYIITMPNSSMLFIDREKNKALLKSTDNMCNSYSRYFNITETDESGNVLQPQSKDNYSQVDLSQFAKKEELCGFVTYAQYQELLDQIQVLKDIIGKPNSKQVENKQNSSDLPQGRINPQKETQRPVNQA